MLLATITDAKDEEDDARDWKNDVEDHREIMYFALRLYIALPIEKAVGHETAEHRSFDIRLKVNTASNLVF